MAAPRKTTTPARSSSAPKTLGEQVRDQLTGEQQPVGPRLSTAKYVDADGEHEAQIRPLHKVEAMDHPYATTEARAALVATWLAAGSPGGEDGFGEWAGALLDWTVVSAAIPPTNGSKPKRS